LGMGSLKAVGCMIGAAWNAAVWMRQTGCACVCFVRF